MWPFDTFKTECLIKFILAIVAAIALIFVGSSQVGKTKQKAIPVVAIISGVILLLWAYSLYTDKKCLKECDSSLWKSAPLIVPEDFEATESSISLCKAQKIAADKSYEAFIACLTEDSPEELYDVMFLDGTTFRGKETACTDCQIFYTSKFSPILDPEVSREVTEACPINPYPYCATDDIDKIYVNLNCHASTSLIKKFIEEGKLEDINDPRIVKCCETPEVCRADGIRAFPVVVCTDNRKFQGYCP